MCESHPNFQLCHNSCLRDTSFIIGRGAIFPAYDWSTETNPLLSLVETAPVTSRDHWKRSPVS